MRFIKTIVRFTLPFAGIVLLGSCGLRLPVNRNPIDTVPPKPVASVQTSKRSGQRTELTHPKDPDVLVWLLADTLHTGMVFPYDWLVDSGFKPPANFGSPRAVSMSWGNRDAYVEKRWLSPWKVFRALFTPSPSVMEIIPIEWDIVETVPHQRIYQKLVPREKGAEVAAFLNNCSRMDSNGRPVQIGPSSWGKGVLLESRHSYFFPRICNVWTVQAIEATGCDMNAWFGLSANGIIRQAEKPPNNFAKVWNGPEKTLP